MRRCIGEQNMTSKNKNKKCRHHPYISNNTTQQNAKHIQDTSVVTNTENSRLQPAFRRLDEACFSYRTLNPVVPCRAMLTFFLSFPKK